MAAALFFMALVGCGEGEAPCRQLSVLETRYESQAACLAATEAVLVRIIDGDYPIIVAQCRKDGAASTLRPKDLKLPEPEHGRPFRS